MRVAMRLNLVGRTVHELGRVRRVMGSCGTIHAILRCALQAMGLISDRRLDGKGAGPLLYYPCQSRAYLAHFMEMLLAKARQSLAIAPDMASSMKVSP